MAGDHDTALVPLEAWCYSSPGLPSTGQRVDMGLLAEALVYYDRVLVNVPTQPMLGELLAWFVERGLFERFLRLMSDGIVRFYDFAFVSTAIRKGDVYMLYNMQDEAQAEPESFERRFLNHAAVEAVFPDARQRKALHNATRGNVIEVKSAQFGAAIENARADLNDAGRHALVVQSFLDELHATRGLPPAPEVRATVTPRGEGTHTVTWNIDFDGLARFAGPELNWHAGTPLVAAAATNRLVWAAALQECDLFLGAPISTLVGDKLYEGSRVSKGQQVVGKLQAEVEFPNIRTLVNAGALSFEEVLRIRRKAVRFRRWLQSEGERDRNAIIAYHHEVAEEAGLVKFGRKALRLFGVLGGAAAGATFGGVGAAMGVAGGTFLVELAARLGSDWRPVVFGNWLQDRIKRLLEGNQESEA